MKVFSKVQGRARDVLLLTGGTVIGQAALIASAPLITRLYTPEDMGVFAVFGALGIITVIGSLHYELAIPLPAADKDAFNLLALSLALVLTLSIFMVPVLMIGGHKAVVFLKAGKLYSYLWLLPAGFFVSGAAQALTIWAIRKKTFKLNAVAKGSQGIGQAVPQVAFGFAHGGPFGLIIGQIAGQILSAGVLLRGMVAGSREKLEVSLSDVRSVASEYRRFPLYTSWSSLINVLSLQMPVFLLSHSYGVMVTGFYALSYRILQLPMRFVGQSISQVFFSAAADAHRDGKLGAITFRLYMKLIRFLLPAMIIISLIAPELFAVCFGKKWHEAGVYSQFIMPWLLMSFIVATLSVLVSVLQQQPVELVFQIVYLFVIAGSLWLGNVLGGVYWSLGLLGCCGGAFMLVKLMWILRLTGNSLRVCMMVLFRECAIVLPGAALLIMAKSFAINQIIVCAIGSICLLALLLYNFRFRRAAVLGA
ncbi:MAG: oligosaccharide flippase family protein [Nitrospiraceae bacterium]|nr:oligosaccharide flippase family protein [Nitrospiraceae bacterium]